MIATLQTRQNETAKLGSFQLLNLNDVRLSGRLAEDPAIRSAMIDKVSVHLNLAVQHNYRDAGGRWHRETSFVPVVVWDSMATYCDRRLRKGTPVYIEGRIRNDQWKSVDGTRHSAVRVYASRVQAMPKRNAMPSQTAIPLELIEPYAH